MKSEDMDIVDLLRLRAFIPDSLRAACEIEQMRAAFKELEAENARLAARVEELEKCGHRPDTDSILMHHRAIATDRDRLAAIVERLPKTADGVPIVTGDTVYFWSTDEEQHGIASDEVDRVECGDIVVLMEWEEERIEDVYSTREAAEAAASAKENDR